MRRELKFERRLAPTMVINQLKDIRKDIGVLKKRQEQILEVLGEYQITEFAKKSLKVARETPQEKYIAHEDVKR